MTTSPRVFLQTTPIGFAMLLVAGCYGTPNHCDLDPACLGEDASGGAAAAGASGAGGVAGGAGTDGGAALEITSPPSPAYTNKAIDIQVSVNGGGTGGVQLLKNGTPLATLTGPPYSFSWDTTKEQEGSYQLVAQMVVGGQIAMSVPVTVVVDRTPPTIASSVPASGATNVSLTDPIAVVFSESLAPASVTGGVVRLALGSVAVNATASLGADGKTITVAVADRSSLALPGAMTETVASTITDLAGNAFAGATWGASVPAVGGHGDGGGRVSADGARWGRRADRSLGCERRNAADRSAFGRDRVGYEHSLSGDAGNDVTLRHLRYRGEQHRGSFRHVDRVLVRSIGPLDWFNLG